MRVLLCAVSVIAGAVVGPLWPVEASACSFATLPGKLVSPRDLGQGVPLNTKIVVATSGGSGEVEAFQLARLDGGGVVTVPISAERLPFASQTEGRVRLTPENDLQPNSVYAVCHWPSEPPQIGSEACPSSARIGTFTTGTDLLTTSPAVPDGLQFEVAEVDFPDAGSNLFCSGPRRVRGITVNVPDAGQELLYFGRAGDAGIFSAEPGEWLPNGMSTVDGATAGILACDGQSSVPMVSWGLPTGTTALEVWTEDVAGNASTPMLIPLSGDCSVPYDVVIIDDDHEKPTIGCSAMGGGLVAWSLASLVVLFARRQSLRA